MKTVGFWPRGRNDTCGRRRSGFGSPNGRILLFASKPPPSDTSTSFTGESNKEERTLDVITRVLVAASGRGVCGCECAEFTQRCRLRRLRKWDGRSHRGCPVAGAKRRRGRLRFAHHRESGERAGGVMHGSQRQATGMAACVARSGFKFAADGGDSRAGCGDGQYGSEKTHARSPRRKMRS